MSVESLAAASHSATSADDALVRRARLGDAAAFETLLATRIDRCYRLAWSILLNDEDAADATQEAFVAAWRQLPRLRDSSAFDGWLNLIVANAARMARLHQVRLREVRVGSPTPDVARRRGTSRLPTRTCGPRSTTSPTTTRSAVSARRFKLGLVRHSARRA